MEGEDGKRVDGKGKWGKGNPGKVEGGGEEQDKGDQQTFPLSSSSPSKLLRFFSKSDSSLVNVRSGSANEFVMMKSLSLSLSGFAIALSVSVIAIKNCCLSFFIKEKQKKFDCFVLISF